MRKIAARLGLLVILTLCLPAPVPAQTPGTVKWQYWNETVPKGSPAIGADGLIFYGQTGGLKVMEPNGNLKWSLDSYQGGDPAIGPDGTVYFNAGLDNDYFSAFFQGQIMWSLTEYHASPRAWGIAQDGTIYLSNSYRLHALTPAGGTKWPYNVGYGSGMAIGPDGTLYCAADYKLQALTPEGDFLWDYPCEMSGSPIVDLRAPSMLRFIILQFLRPATG